MANLDYDRGSWMLTVILPGTDSTQSDSRFLQLEHATGSDWADAVPVAVPLVRIRSTIQADRPQGMCDFAGNAVGIWFGIGLAIRRRATSQ